MKKMLRNIKTSFQVAAVIKDLFLSDNFKNSRAMDALSNYEILNGKLNRIGMEINNKDFSDPVIEDFLNQLSNTISNQ